MPASKWNTERAAFPHPLEPAILGFFKYPCQWHDEVSVSLRMTDNCAPRPILKSYRLIARDVLKVLWRQGKIVEDCGFYALALPENDPHRIPGPVRPQSVARSAVCRQAAGALAAQRDTP